jgi:hypothetical protein
MSERDWALLNFLAASRLATGKQLVARFWTCHANGDPARARAGRRALKRLSEWRVLDPLPGRARGGQRGGSATLIYRVGVAGAKLLARRGWHQKRLAAPGERYIAHTLACAQIAVDLHVAHGRGDLDLIEVQHEPACHRGFLGPMGARLMLKPDLFVRIGAGGLEDRWFVECDLASEHANTLLGKANRYIAHRRSGAEQRDHGVYPRVLWVAPDDRRASEVESILARPGAEAGHLFSICRFDETAEFLAAEARS